MSEEDLHIAEKRTEVKGKGEREQYIHVKEEFQRTARRDKKAFLSEQCKEIEETIEWERQRSLQENWRCPGNIL